NFSAGGSGSPPPGAAVASVLLGDFNHDGKLDFAFVTTSRGPPCSLFFGNGDGTFAAPVTLGASTGGSPVLVKAADLNGDGYTDIVYMVSFYQAPNQIRILLSASDGSYTDTPVALPTPPAGFVIADFNNDHVPDLFVIDG